MRTALAAWIRFHRTRDPLVRERCRNLIRYGVPELPLDVRTVFPLEV